MKYLLVFALIGLVFWMWRSQRPNRQNQYDKQSTDNPPNSSRTLAPATEMVACVFCHVHLPRPDAVSGARGLYCCTKHKQLAGDQAP